MTSVDFIIVAAYLAFVLLVGVIFARRAGRSTNEFFISGRNLPWWLAGTSIVATSFASDTPLVVTGWVRQSGISYNWIWWSFAIGGMFSVFLLARLWRRARVVTDVELTELRYGGKPAAVLRAFRGAYMALPVNCIILAWVIVAMKKLMEVVLGMNPFWAVAICLALTLAYSVLSGFWGVVITDLFQFAIATAGSIALAVVTVVHFGGLASLWERARAASHLGDGLLHFFPRPPEGASPFEAKFWSGPIFAFGVFLFIQWWANKNADGGGVAIQRMSAAKDERHSLLATLWFNIANYALRPWPWIIVALGSVLLMPEGNDEKAYVEVMKALAPPGLMGLMVASFVGAFMSTVDTHLNLSSAYLVNDVYRRFVRKNASERFYVLISRILSAYVMLLAASMALVSDSISGLFTFLLAFTSGAGVVLILRWFWWRINAWSELSSMTASAVISSCLYGLKLYVARTHPETDLSWMSPQWILLMTVIASGAVWLPVTFLTAPVSREKLIEFYRRVRPYGAWGQIAAHSGVPPARGFARMVFNGLAGAVMVLGATFSIGKFLLGSPWQGAFYLALAAAGAAVVWLELRRLRRETGGAPDPTSEAEVAPPE